MALNRREFLKNILVSVTMLPGISKDIILLVSDPAKENGIVAIDNITVSPVKRGSPLIIDNFGVGYTPAYRVTEGGSIMINEGSILSMGENIHPRCNCTLVERSNND